MRHISAPLMAGQVLLMILAPLGTVNARTAPSSYGQGGFIPNMDNADYTGYNWWMDKNYSPTQPCFECIRDDHVYCRNGTAPTLVVAAGETPPPQEYCCKSYFECPPLYWSDWICSTKFADKINAYRMCPQNYTNCGLRNRGVIVQTKPGDIRDFNMTLSPGEHCSFLTRTKCGFPSLYFETSKDWADLDILIADFGD